MIRTLKCTAAVGGIIVLGSAALVACSETDESAASAPTATVAGLSGSGGAVVGEGATSQHTAMSLFAQAYNQNTGGSLSYNATGSGAGQKQFIGGTVDFGGSDSPLNPQQQEAAKQRCGGHEAWHLPLVIGPVAVAYNLPGAPGLVLTPELLAKIFKGEITRWNDSAIAELNGALSLPEQDISVIYRSEESGTSDNFQKFLTAAAPGQWEGAGKSFPTATGSGANGSAGVVSEVGATEGAITYVEAGFAKEAGLDVARIDFGAGPVELNTESVGKALDAVEFAGGSHDLVVDGEKLYAQREPGAYPLVLNTYELVCSQGYEPEVAARVKDFLLVALANQNQSLEEQGYIPLSGEYKKKVEAAVEAIQ